jgi:adenosine deaminase
MVRIHAGEVGRIDNVRKAIENLTITNMAHGIDIANDENLMALAKRKNIQFDLALTSNLLIRKDLTTHNHPLYKMMEHGLNCTISSDDPVIFNTTLANEYTLVHDTKIIETLKHNSRKFTNKYGYLL